MMEAPKEDMPGCIAWARLVSRMFTLSRLPRSINVKTPLLYHVPREYMVAHVPGGSLSVDGSEWDTVRLGFSYQPIGMFTGESQGRPRRSRRGESRGLARSGWPRGA